MHKSKTVRTQIIKWSQAAPLVFILLMLEGCGATPQEQIKTSPSYLSQVTELRQIFDKYGGDISKLTPAEKKKFIDFEGGDESLVPVYWEHMRNPNSSVGSENKAGKAGQ